MQLDGQSVLVTGANRGLGAHLVRSLLEAGAAKVWAGTRDPRRLSTDDFIDERVVALQLDITDKASIEAAAKQAQDVTVLINNAGVLGPGGPVDGDLDVFQRDVMTNYLGPLQVTRLFLPVLERNAPATIVNILTVTGLAPIRGIAGYCASKAAAHSMTQALRTELKERRIDVIGAYPGGIDTDMVAAIEMMKTPPGDVAARIVEGIQAGESLIWPDPVSASLGSEYLTDPLALERMLGAV